MKLRIVSFGIEAKNERITNLDSLQDPRSISDYDAIVFDSLRVGGLIRGLFGAAQVSETDARIAALERKTTEVAELIGRKGGVAVCLMRGDDPVTITVQRRPTPFYRSWSSYFLLERLRLSNSRPLPTAAIAPGQGVTMTLLPSAPAAGGKYFRLLGNNLRFHAHFVNPIELPARPIAENSIGNVVAAQFPVAGGWVLFLPIGEGVPAEQLGAVFVEVIAMLLKGEPDIEQPSWADAISVPGGHRDDPEISQFRAQIRDLKERLRTLEERKSERLGHRRLLFGTGKAVLEPAVRSAFRLFGFEVGEPETYTGEWDVDLRDPDGETAIGEVEGSESAVSIVKFRQLLNYVVDETLEGRHHKGILIGNGFRNEEPSQRGVQFTEKVLEASKIHSVCLIPATELFKAVVAILEAPNPTVLRKALRSSIFSTSGLWEYTQLSTGSGVGLPSSEVVAQSTQADPPDDGQQSPPSAIKNVT